MLVNKSVVVIVILVFLLLFFTSVLLCEAPESSNSQDLLSDLNLLVLPSTGSEQLEYKGINALRLKPAKGERIAILKDYEFFNGTIELDIAAIPAYTGLVFRVRDPHIYEGIYFRPQNSRQADPIRRGHTVQYHAPPRYTWYHLRETAPEKFESAADLPPEEWFHVKIAVSGAKAEVYVNEAPKPCLVIEDLKHGASTGSVGVWCGNGSGGTFANLKIQASPSSANRNGNGDTSQAEAKTIYTAGQEYLFDIFQNRRSVRSFKPDPIPQEHILKILDIARSGPTSGNQQPWKFLVIQDPEKIARLKEACITQSLDRAKQRDNFDPAKLESLRKRYEKNLSGYFSAPAYVVVLVDKNSRYPSYNIYDGSIAAGYLMIAARALGYGTVFITDSIPADVTLKALEIPDNFERICITPLGIPEEWPKKREKNSLNDVAVFEKLIAGVNYTVPITRKAIKLDTGLLDEYVGSYKMPQELTLTVTREQDRMFGQVSGQEKFELFPEKKDKFFLKVADVQISFTRDTQGKVTDLTVHQGGQDIPGKKT